MGRHTHRKHQLGRRQWFINQKRRKRAGMTVALRWTIKNDRDGEGIFTSHQYIPGSPSWLRDGGAASEACIMHWADIAFCSARPAREGIFYNATVHTVADRVVSDIEDEARNAVMEQLSDQDREAYQAHLRFCFDEMFEKIPGSDCYRMLPRRERTWDSLGGLTMDQARARWIRNYMDNGLRQRPVYASFTKDVAYRWGVGLDMVLDAVSLSTHAIVAGVMDFWAKGEQDGQWAVDIRPHLPAITAKLLHTILIQEREGDEKIDWDKHLDDEQLRHVGYNAVSLKI